MDMSNVRSLFLEDDHLLGPCTEYIGAVSPELRGFLLAGAHTTDIWCDYADRRSVLYWPNLRLADLPPHIRRLSDRSVAVSDSDAVLMFVLPVNVKDMRELVVWRGRQLMRRRPEVGDEFFIDSSVIGEPVGDSLKVKVTAEDDHMLTLETKDGRQFQRDADELITWCQAWVDND